MVDSHEKPERTHAEEAFMREARIGLTVVAILFVVFLYVAFGKLSGWFRTRPPAEVTVARSTNGQDVTRQQLAPHQKLRPHAADSFREADTPPLSAAESQSKPSTPIADHTFPDTGLPPSPQIVPGQESGPFVGEPFTGPAGLLAGPRQQQNEHSNGPQTNRLRSNPPVNPPQHPLQAQPVDQHQREPVQTPFPTPATEEAGSSSPSPIQQMGLTEPLTELRASTPGFVYSLPDDSFWTIAQRVYGDGRYFKALYEVNRDHVKNYDGLPEGTRVATPPKQALQRRFPGLCPRGEPATSPNTETEYVSKSGETLFDIARDQMGQASRYLDILRLNRDVLPNDVSHLSPLPGGLKLTLPRSR